MIRTDLGALLNQVLLAWMHMHTDISDIPTN